MPGSPDDARDIPRNETGGDSMKGARALGAVLLVTMPAAAGAGTRPLRPDDIFKLKEVSDPAVSPDGRSVAFEVTTLDADKDESDTDIWMAPFDGGEAIRLTASAYSETSPRFSPDGRYLAFLSDRDGTWTQVWLMDRRGGEAVRLTDFKANVSALAWSPDGGRLALIVKDVDHDDPDTGDGKETVAAADKDKPPKPIVIRRLKFKRDGEGYLTDLRHHIHVFDVAAKTSVAVTAGPYDDSEPAWSPDGRSIAFTSNRTADPDGNENTDVFLVQAKAGAVPRRLTTSAGTDGAPVFSPDGRTITFVAGGDPKDIWYGTLNLGVVTVGGGPETILTRTLDRVVAAPRFSPDGRSILFVVEEGGNSHLARVPAGGGPVERVVDGELDVQAFDVGKGGEIALLASRPDQPSEVSAVAGGGLRRISHVNDDFLKGIALGAVERFKAKSRDGTMVDGFLVRPPATPARTKLPAVLLIHGGPNGQYSTAFDEEWQMLAAGGYAVIGANPRGSTGYGQAFSRAIFADWGNKDYDDIIASVDHVVAMGAADPDRLGVGGWSYGGMMTDAVITKTTRFKAAVAGAGEANAFANYGVDEYVYAWEMEAGLPWKNVSTWMRLSPWFQIDKVKTPTLFLGGSEDHNVPIVNSEQMYESLRRLGIETELVIYPDEYHDITRPSFQKDVLERYIAWYDKHLKGAAR
jgi:dipeptidyl aminopeptidase/acylaminoacyl peptidase